MTTSFSEFFKSKTCTVSSAVQKNFKNLFYILFCFTIIYKIVSFSMWYKFVIRNTLSMIFILWLLEVK